jgi:hypothetical protein
LSRTWTCSRCGDVHTGLPDVAFDAPLPWEQLDDEERAAGELDSDTCEIHSADGDFYYVRGILEIPIRDFDQTLGYGVWGSLSEANFARFVELYDDPSRVDEPPYTSWFGNRIPGFPDTFNLKAWVETRSLDLRPSIVLHGDQEHPLVAAQREGIELAQAIALIEPYLH